MPPPGAIVSASPDADGIVSPAQTTDPRGANALGLVVVADGTGPSARVQVRPGGLLALTVAQWTAVGAAPGGLARGAVYYLSEDRPGFLSATRPQKAGSFSVRIGVALSTTALLVQIGEPVQVSSR